MPHAKNGPAVGLLHPLHAPAIRLVRYHPSDDLAPFVEHYWIVRWDIGDTPRRQETLPHPSVHIVVERGASGVFGVVRSRFMKEISGCGRAASVRFRPGGFAAFWRSPMHELTGRVLPLDEAFGPAGAEYERAVLAAPDEDAAFITLAEDFLRRLNPVPDESLAVVRQAIEIVGQNREVNRVDDLAARVGVSVRSLQRLFGHRVGVSPKWVIARARLQDAAALVVAGEDVDWSRLALDLGYFDQAHLIRAYRSIIGVTPAAHARRVKESANRPSPTRAASNG